MPDEVLRRVEQTLYTALTDIANALALSATPAEVHAVMEQVLALRGRLQTMIYTPDHS